MAQEHVLARYSGCKRLRENLKVLQDCLDNRIVPKESMKSHLKEMSTLKNLIAQEQQRISDYKNMVEEYGGRPPSHVIKRQEFIRRISKIQEEEEEIDADLDADFEGGNDGSNSVYSDSCEADEEFLEDGNERARWKRLCEMESSLDG